MRHRVPGALRVLIAVVLVVAQQTSALRSAAGLSCARVAAGSWSSASASATLEAVSHVAMHAAGHGDDEAGATAPPAPRCAGEASLVVRAADREFGGPGGDRAPVHTLSRWRDALPEPPFHPPRLI